MTPKYITNNAFLIAEVNDFISTWNNSAHTITAYSSGSTGKPKPIVLQKVHMRASANMTGRYFNLKQGESILLNMSPKTIGGMMVIVRAIELNLRLIVTDVSASPLESIDEHIDFAAMVPLQVSTSLERCPKKFALIKTLIIGGGAISTTLSQQITSLKCNVYQTFGMTETISHIALKNLKSTDVSYETLDGVTIETENECLVISSPHLGLNRLKTNDIIELITPTRFNWLGRSDFAINSGGIKIIPEVIESKLHEIIKSNFFSIGLPDSILGQRHVLIIESAERLEIKKSDFTSIEKYQIPKEIYYLNSFKYTTSGKINKPLTLESLNDAEKQVL
jgi:o-succinylbenzoate---CoA ligase